MSTEMPFEDSQSDASPDSSPDASRRSLSQAPVEGHRILIVESEVEAADDLARIMEAMGHVIKVCADAKTALFDLHDFDPHLVLLGTYLSDMPGYELSSILRGAPQYSYKFRHVSLLYVADRHKLLKHRFIGAPDVPMAHYIFKPLNEVEVRDKVTRALRAGVI